jgi:uncharacterized repeat protein (TIGR01451 family)
VSPRALYVRAALTAGLALLGRPAAAQTYDLSWWTVDGGGTVGAAGGTFTLSGTAGQPDAGPAQTGGAFALAGGFWALPTPAGGPTADLSIVKSDMPDPVVGLQPLTYLLAVSNAGPDGATSVAVSDTLPPGVVFQSAGGSGWSCAEAGGTVTCTRPALAVGAAPLITIVVSAPPQAGTLVNTASVQAAESDPVPGNGTDSEPTTVTAAPLADLALDKSDGGVEARWGQPFTYTVVVSNAGPQAVSGATVTDALPPSLTGATWACAASAGSTCPAGGAGDLAAPVSLLAGGSAAFTVTGTVTPGTLTLVNTATATPPSGVFDPNAANNADTVTTTARPILYHTLAPCRLADTRSTHPPALGANTSRDFDVAGRCGIPADARAVALILTTVQQTDRGNLRLYPAGGAVPLASSLNFVAGRARANNAVIPLGAAGRITVQVDMPAGSTGQTHFLFDVYGYFR